MMNHTQIFSFRSKKVTIDPINKNNNKCFQYAATFALNHEENKKDSGRKIKLNVLQIFEKQYITQQKMIGKIEDRR